MTVRQQADEADERVRAQPGQLRKIRPRDMAIRFGFGAAISTLAGIISALDGPRAGGVFLAFPAILLASLTLVAQEEGLKTARDDARGAALGAIGFIGFAIVCLALAERINGWLTLLIATVTWMVLSLAAYAAVRALSKSRRH